MSSLPTPNYMTVKEVNVYTRGGNKPLPAGSFVRPIDNRYLPSHVTQDVNFDFFDEKRECYCYTSYGIVLMYWQDLRKV